MKEKTTVIKVERTDEHEDNTAFYIKAPRKPIEDEFGNKADGLFDKIPVDIKELERKVEEGKEAEKILEEIEKLK